MGFFSKELKNEFETAVVNEPSMFEPLKFYCKYTSYNTKRDSSELPNVCLISKIQRVVIATYEITFMLGTACDICSRHLDKNMCVL